MAAVNRLRDLVVDLTPLRTSRDFRFLWLTQLASTGGRQIVVVAVPYQVYLLTHSSLAVGLLGLFQATPLILAGLYGGGLADRFDRRRLQLIGKSVVAMTSLALTAGAVVHAPVGFIYATVAVAAAATTIDQSARSATVPRLVPRRLLPSAMSLTSSLFYAAAIAGPALAGLILATAGPAWAYAVDVLTFFPALFFLSRLSPQPPLPGQVVNIGFRAPLAALRFVGGRQLILGIFVADLVAMIFGMPLAVFPALALSVFRIGAGGLGLLYAAPAAGALLGSLLSGWVRHVVRQGRWIFVSIAVWGLAIAIFGLVGSRLWVGLPLLALAGAADLVSAIFRGTILQTTVPDAMRGRMSAFQMMVVTAGPRLGDVEAGAVATVFNPVISVVSGGVACVVGIAILAGLLPKLRGYRAEPEPAPAIPVLADPQ
ncbi:MAG: MFS transporter [Candidatus Dormibacteraceae bacterium]